MLFPFTPKQTHGQQCNRAVVVILQLAALVFMVRSESSNPDTRSRKPSLFCSNHRGFVESGLLEIWKS